MAPVVEPPELNGVPPSVPGMPPVMELLTPGLGIVGLDEPAEGAGQKSEQPHGVPPEGLRPI